MQQLQPDPLWDEGIASYLLGEYEQRDAPLSSLSATPVSVFSDTLVLSINMRVSHGCEPSMLARPGI